MLFVASIFLKSIHPENTGDEWLWEEQLILVEAEDETDAYKIANEIGKGKEISFHNIKNETVKWIFVKTERVCLIKQTSLRSGMELFSRFLRSSEAESILNPFNDKES